MDYAQIINTMLGIQSPRRCADRPMSEALLPCVELTTGAAPELAIVWLHGLGADGHDFEPIVPELGLPFTARFVFPHAPVRPITINQRIPMRAWFDILTFERGGSEDVAAIRSSARSVTALIERERANGFEPEQIVLAGFSQGGALALHTGLRYAERLGGILVLSAFLVLAGTLERERAAANVDVPIFMAHGLADPVIEIGFAEASRDALVELGYAPDWHTYPMGHAVCGPEIVEISRWLAARAAR